MPRIAPLVCRSAFSSRLLFLRPGSPAGVTRLRIAGTVSLGAVSLPKSKLVQASSGSVGGSESGTASGGASSRLLECR